MDAAGGRLFVRSGNADLAYVRPMGLYAARMQAYADSLMERFARPVRTLTLDLRPQTPMLELPYAQVVRVPAGAWGAAADWYVESWQISTGIRDGIRHSLNLRSHPTPGQTGIWDTVQPLRRRCRFFRRAVRVYLGSMSKKLSCSRLLGAAGNITNILTFLAFTAVSWGALQPVLAGATQWLTTALGTHFTLVALARALQLGISVFVGLRMVQVVRRELGEMRRDILLQWLENMENQTHTQNSIGKVTQLVADRGSDVRRLYIENYLQRILLMGLAARADRASARRAISSQREVVQRQLSNEDDKAMALGVIALYERAVDDSYPDA